MDKGKVLLNLSVNEKIYSVFLKDDNTANAFCYGKDGIFYTVSDDQELDFINKAILMLNRKYIRRKDIDFQNEKLARFENKYNHFSYFSQIKEDGAYTECPYEDYKELYKKYNGLQIRTARKNYNGEEYNWDRILS